MLAVLHSRCPHFYYHCDTGSWNRDSESLGAGFCNTPLQSIYTHQLIVKCSSIYIYLRLSSHTFCTYIIAFMSLFFTSLNIDVLNFGIIFCGLCKTGFYGHINLWTLIFCHVFILWLTFYFADRLNFLYCIKGIWLGYQQVIFILKFNFTYSLSSFMYNITYA